MKKPALIFFALLATMGMSALTSVGYADESIAEVPASTVETAPNSSLDDSDLTSPSPGEDSSTTPAGADDSDDSDDSAGSDSGDGGGSSSN